MCKHVEITLKAWLVTLLTLRFEPSPAIHELRCRTSLERNTYILCEEPEKSLINFEVVAYFKLGIKIRDNALPDFYGPWDSKGQIELLTCQKFSVGPQLPFQVSGTEW
jgi:hypothetical protein